MERPRWNRATTSPAEWEKIREEWVSQHRQERNRRNVVERVIERVSDGGGSRTVTLRGVEIVLRQADALALFGALAIAVDGQTSRIKLASGALLELTHEEVSDLGRQLAGTPADEISGSDR